MFDAYIGSWNLGVIVLMAALVLVIPGQLWLCGRVEAGWRRLLPVFLLAGATGLLVLLTYTSQSLDGLFYGLFACYTALLLGACGLGWVLWALLKKVGRGVA